MRGANSTPEFPSYGAFRNSNIFGKLFRVKDGHFDDKQKRAADEIVNQVLRHCGGSPHFPKIKTIVDFGCGDGSLLKEIKNALNKEIAKRIPRAVSKNNNQKLKKTSDIQFIGVDLCSDMITLAQKKEKETPQGIEFACIAADAFLTATELAHVDWPSAALLCLGHTWFHMLDQASLLRQIGEKRPALLLLDVFQSWDDVVNELDKRYRRLTKKERVVTRESITLDDKPIKLLRVLVEEETRVVRGRVYSLRTQYIKNKDRSEAPPTEVVRGIHTIDPHSNDKDGYWVFATRQIAKRTEDLRPMPRYGGDPIETLRNIEKLGEITGKNDYLVLREFEHASGWGNMRCIAFAALLREGKALNEAYFETVNEFVKHLFVSKHGANNTTNAVEGLKNLVRIFGRGEVAVIMPFDRLRAFARMVPLYERQETVGNDDSPKRNDESGSKAYQLPEISTVDLIVEQPNRWQQRFPTAYGLYHTLLDLVSSPIGLPLHRVPGYEKGLADEKFEQIETKFLNASQGKQARKGTDRDSSSYFLIPFYVGSLPLFVLILEEPDDLPASATNSQVYFALAQNLDRQLHVVISDEMVRGRVMLPFVVGALQKLEAHTEKTKARAILQELLRDAMEAKPWKSWVKALASHSLTSLDGVDLENKKLMKIANDECTKIEKDLITQISLWFQLKGYFSDARHENFICSDHIELLKELLIVSGKPLKDANYFTSIESKTATNILSFTEELVEAMMVDCDCNSNCGSRNAKGNKVYCAKYTDKDTAFRAAKSLFCWANITDRKSSRFTFSRLFAVVMAVSGRKWEEHKTLFQKVFEWDETNKKSLNHDKRVMTSDIIQEIAAFIAVLNAGEIAEVSVTSPELAYVAGTESDVCVTMTLKVVTKSDLSNLGGQDFHQVFPSRPELKGKKKWKITARTLFNHADQSSDMLASWEHVGC